MLKTFSLSTIAAASLAAPAFSQTAKLVSATAAAGVPEGADFSVKPMGYEYGATLHFFVTGENMISFDKESLVADGWKLGSFPKVSDDGTQASFSIQKKGDFIGKIDALKVEGSIEVMTGKQTKTLTKKLTVGADAVKFDAFEVYAGKAKRMFGGEGINVNGEIGKIKEVKVTQDGKELRSQGSSWSNNSKTYNFADLKGEIEVSLTYWPKLTKAKVKFSK